MNKLVYCILDVPVDGNLTLTENLADHGGLKMALSAYSTWKQEHTDLKLPALPYSDTQLFFLGKQRLELLFKTALIWA